MNNSIKIPRGMRRMLSQVFPDLTVEDLILYINNHYPLDGPITNVEGYQAGTSYWFKFWVDKENFAGDLVILIPALGIIKCLYLKGDNKDEDHVRLPEFETKLKAFYQNPYLRGDD